MGLNKQKGNMYGFVDFTWNPIKGRCPHDCNYCYMHRFWNMMKNDELRLDEKELKTNLGEGNFIFVGSSTDMWARRDSITWWGWQSRVKDHIAKYPDNEYLFQTKYPFGYAGWSFDKNNILGITLETNREHPDISKAPDPIQRVRDFVEINHSRKMVTIEPIMDFDLEPLVLMIKTIKPEWVNIGADSGGNKLPEPDWDQIDDLYNSLMTFTEVKYKSNLKRLL